MFEDLAHFLKHPDWRRQHRWRRAIWQGMNRLGLTGMHGLPMSRRWVEIHRRKMPLAGLDPALHGLKIVQISDLHYSPVVWQRYLIQYLELMDCPWQWTLSGLAPGRQLAASAIGRRFNKHRYRHYPPGYYAVQGRHLCVNRGLSYGQRVMDWCRPEITVFRVTAGEAAEI